MRQVWTAGTAMILCAIATIGAAQASTTPGVVVQASPAEGCAVAVTVRAHGDDLERIAQGDTLHEAMRLTQEIEARCPQTRDFTWEVYLGSVRKMNGRYDRGSGRFSLVWQDPDAARLITARQREGRWRPLIEQQRAAAQQQQERDRQVAVRERTAATSPAVAGSAVDEPLRGIRVRQLNARRCESPLRLRLEIASLDFIATGDDQYALMEVARQIWKDCPDVAWTEYEILHEGQVVRSGEGRRNTRLDTLRKISHEANEAYLRGAREGRRRPALPEERDGLPVPADIPETAEGWAAVYRNAEAGRLARQAEDRQRAEIEAAMRPDGSGLAPYRREACHGLKQAPRSSQRPTERDVCEAVVDHIYQRAGQYRLAYPEGALQCSESFDWKHEFPGGLLCSYAIEQVDWTGIGLGAGGLSFQFSNRSRQVLRTAGSWSDIPAFPAVFAFDAQARQWRVHPRYEAVVAERTRPRSPGPEELAAQESRDSERRLEQGRRESRQLARETVRTMCTVDVMQAGGSYLDTWRCR